MRVPAAAGVNVTLMVQFPDTGMPELHELVSPKSPLSLPVRVMLETVNAALPPFEIVTGKEVLVVFTACEVKFSEVVEKLVWPPFPVPVRLMELCSLGSLS